MGVAFVFCFTFFTFFNSATLKMVTCDPAVAAIFFFYWVKRGLYIGVPPVYTRVFSLCLCGLPYRGVRWIFPKNVIEKQKSKNVIEKQKSVDLACLAVNAHN